MHDTSFCDLSRSSSLTIEDIDEFSFNFRPDTIESLVIAFRLTCDERFRKVGWDTFQEIEAHYRTETGCHWNVWVSDAAPEVRLDNMKRPFW